MTRSRLTDKRSIRSQQPRESTVLLYNVCRRRSEVSIPGLFERTLRPVLGPDLRLRATQSIPHLDQRWVLAVFLTPQATLSTSYFVKQDGDFIGTSKRCEQRTCHESSQPQIWR